MADKKQKILWQDRRRVFGIPLSFDRYILYDDKLVTKKGLVIETRDELLTYRIMDIKLKKTLSDRIFGVGTIILYTGDTTDKELRLEKVQNPYKVYEILSNNAKYQREQKGIEGRELYGYAAE